MKFLRAAWVVLGLASIAVASDPAMRSRTIGQFQLDKAPRQGGLAHGNVPPGTTRLVIDGKEAGFAADGLFIVGFGRDHAATTLITAYRADGTNVTEILPVLPTAWRIENLRSLPRRRLPDAEFEAIRSLELAQIETARKAATGANGWRQRFIWPVPGRITGQFGAQRIYAGEPGAPHNGVDLAGAVGTPVLAPADGVVILAATAPFTLEGNLLMLDHGLGLNSAFLHLSRIDVKLGEQVRQGQQIGAIGMTGRATGPHLHWGMKWQDERIDPAMLAPRRQGDSIGRAPAPSPLLAIAGLPARHRPQVRQARAQAFREGGRRRPSDPFRVRSH